jgi:hypothetical protein
MARLRSPARLLLDTSAVVDLLHGHTLQNAAVRDAVAGGQVLAPVSVRMEYLRAVVVNRIVKKTDASVFSATQVCGKPRGG